MADTNERRVEGVQGRFRLSLVSPNVRFSGRALSCPAPRVHNGTTHMRRALDAV